MKLEIVREMKLAIEALKERLLTLRGLAQSATSPVLDDLPKAKPSGKSRVESLTVKIVTAEAELESEENEMLTVAGILAEEIYRRVKDFKAARILIMRYVVCKSWKTIIAEHNLSAARIFSLHRKGAKMFRSKVGDLL